MMRGWKLRIMQGAVALASMLGLLSPASAQKDPQTAVFLDNVTVCPTGYTFTFDAKTCVKDSDSTVTDPGRKLTTVTLSRAGLDTRSAYDLFIVNNTTNALNRLYFTLTVTDNNGDAADNPAFDVVYGGDPSGNQFACTSTPTPTQQPTGFRLDCTSNISLDPNTGYMRQKVVVVVKTPRSGSSLTVTGAAGGYEGNSSTGQGCCAQPFPGPVLTSLVDSTKDTTLSYTVNAITFVKGDVTTRVFTGNQAVPSRTDPFATDLSVAPFEPSTGKKYDIGRIFETPKPADPGTNCKNGNRFKSCYQTQLSLPQVHYDLSTTNPDDPYLLTILLKIHTSLLKGSATNFDVNTIVVRYTSDDGAATNLSSCFTTTPVVFPCVYSRTYVGSVITLTIKNTRNGFLEFF